MAGEVEAVEPDAGGDGGAGGEDQDHTEEDQPGERRQGPAVDGPPPAAEGAGVGAGEGRHDAALSDPFAAPAGHSASTSRRKASPRSSKLANWSNEAQAGDRSTTAPGRASRGAILW